MGKPTLVLLHGALGSAAHLEPLAALLRESFDVLTVDFDGHGGRPPRNGTPTMQRFADDVLGLLDRNGIGAARIFGYSMGGYVALHLAATHPTRVERVATFGTKLRWDAATAEREASRLDPAKMREKIPKFVDTLAARHVGAGGWARVVTDTATLLRGLGAAPLLTNESFASIPQPVRIIVGDGDGTVSVEECADVVARLARGELVVLPDTPHPFEQVDLARLATAIGEFMSS